MCISQPSADLCLSCGVPPAAVPFPAMLPPSLSITRHYPQTSRQRAGARPIPLCLSGLSSGAGFLPNFKSKSLKVDGMPYFCPGTCSDLQPQAPLREVELDSWHVKSLPSSDQRRAAGIWRHKHNLSCSFPGTLLIQSGTSSRSPCDASAAGVINLAAATLE